jgi:hypothetical protein
MNKQERKAWKKYIRQVADLMHLKDWKFVLDKEPANPNNGAEMDSVFGRKEVHIRLSPTWAAFTPKQQRYYVVHEITHTYFEPMDHHLCGKMKRAMSTTDLEAWHEDYMLPFEYGIDDSARTIARGMPLPAVGQVKKVQKA